MDAAFWDSGSRDRSLFYGKKIFGRISEFTGE